MAQAPPALLRWFKSSYPTLVFDPEWIGPCVEYLQAHFPESTPPQLIKKVENQLLLSDLATSVLPSPSLLPSPLPAHSTTLFPARPDRVLVQIVAIDEVAHPALWLLDTLKDKRERRRIDAIGRERKDGEEEVKVGVYPRGMVKVRLSDGHTECEGIEYQLVPGMGLEDVRLGCKLLLHSVRAVRGTLLLSPASVEVKGFSVEELEETAEAQLESRLRERLGLPPEDPTPPPTPPAPAPAQMDVDPADEDEEEAAAAAFNQPPPAPRRNPPPLPAPKAKLVPPPPKPNPLPTPKPTPAPANAKPAPPPPPSAPKPALIAKPKPKPVLAPPPPTPNPKPQPRDPSSDFGRFEFDEDAMAELDALERQALSPPPPPQPQKLVVPPPAPPKSKRMEVDDDLGLDGLDFDLIDDGGPDEDDPPLSPPLSAHPQSLVVTMEVDSPPPKKKEARGTQVKREALGTQAKREKPWEGKEKKRAIEVVEIGSSDGDEDVERVVSRTVEKPKPTPKVGGVKVGVVGVGAKGVKEGVKERVREKERGEKARKLGTREHPIVLD